MNGFDFSLDFAIKHCVSKGILVFGLPLEKLALGQSIYSTTQTLIESGMIPLPPMSLESAFGKISLLLSKCTDYITKEIEKKYVGEIFDIGEIEYLK